MSVLGYIVTHVWMCLCYLTLGRLGYRCSPDCSVPSAGVVVVTDVTAVVVF